ncbi:hypothetical protein A9K55_001449 [Cordyceps militaris]|uniref:Uncharacterized protein n=1 Tax=Cordyceps militaris TaxID=73501 RepID=A0A2H4ST14_CORMI|nr:hypothetical protein A9K55_001449 [Cordyceps militaris]
MSPTASSQLLAEQHTFKQAALREWGAGTRAAVAGGAHKAQRNTRRECWPRPQQLLRAARTKPRNIQEGSAGRVPSGPLRESAAGPADRSRPLTALGSDTRPAVGEIVRLGPESAIATLQSSGTFKIAGQFSQTELTSDRYFLGGPEVNHRRESGALTNRSVWLGSVSATARVDGQSPGEVALSGDQKRQPAPISWRVWRGRLKGGGYRDWGRLWMLPTINGGRGRDKQPDDSSISEEPQHQTAPGPGQPKLAGGDETEADAGVTPASQHHQHHQHHQHRLHQHQHQYAESNCAIESLWGQCIKSSHQLL